MNWYHNTNPFTYQKAKKEYAELTLNQLPKLDTPISRFSVEYQLYYKNTACDGSNIIALIEKMFLDALQHANIVTNDNVTCHIQSTWTAVNKDVDNPRCHITVKEL